MSKSKRLEACLTADDLRELLDYDPETGVLTWRWRSERWFMHSKHRSPSWLQGTWNGKFAGKPALTAVNSRGYYTGTVLGVSVSAHRVAWCHYHGDWPVGVVDHINRDKTDNRIANLRDVDQSTNLLNTTRSEAEDVGVYQRDGKWVGQVKVRGETYYTARFVDKQRAVSAKQALAQEVRACT